MTKSALRVLSGLILPTKQGIETDGMSGVQGLKIRAGVAVNLRNEVKAALRRALCQSCSRTNAYAS